MGVFYDYNNGIGKVGLLEHIVHYKNLDSILSNGLLSRIEIHKRGLVKEDIAMDEVLKIRAKKTMEGGVTPAFTSQMEKFAMSPLNFFVPLYFNSKNPMLYKRKSIQHELFILLIQKSILDEPNTFFSDGNAAANESKFFRGTQHLQNIPFEVLESGRWDHPNPDIKAEKKRQMCAEVLVPEIIPISHIPLIACINESMVQIAKDAIQKAGEKAAHIFAVPMPDCYF